jgi:topoisomerase-4 subunit A
MGVIEVLKAFLDHRLEVLQRRTQHRLDRIAHRLEVLEGYLIVYANLDEVIRLIRESDEPKPALMARWDLTEVQADAILNMRLRALARLQEIEIREEHAKLTAEQAELLALLADDALQWERIGEQIADIRAKFGKKTPLGKRRTEIAGPPGEVDLSVEALVEREPLTVVVSEQGWVRALKGHLAPDAEVKYKDGDGERFRLPCQNTDRILLFTASGRAHTLSPDKLPGGRGQGEPLRLLVDLAAEDTPIALRVVTKEERLILAASDGRGFQIAAEACVAQTKTGRQVMTPGAGASLAVVVPVQGDHVAVIGENRRLLIFPLSQLAEMTRGRGVMLQRYKGAGLSDLTTITLEAGRAGAGRQPPHGFPRDNKFG